MYLQKDGEFIRLKIADPLPPGSVRTRVLEHYPTLGYRRPVGLTPPFKGPKNDKEEEFNADSPTSGGNEGDDEEKRRKALPFRQEEPYPFGSIRLQQRYPGISEKNKVLVVINIRHFYNVFWLLVFSNWMLAIAFGSITYKLICVSQKTFGISTVYSYLLPSTVIEVLLILTRSIIACLRVINFRSSKLKKLYYIFFVINIGHYLIMFIAVPLRLYFNLTALKPRMQADLRTSLNKDIAEIFAVTQQKRQCCGIDTLNDWIYKPHSKIQKDQIYPSSCCRFDDSVCTSFRLF